MSERFMRDDLIDVDAWNYLHPPGSVITIDGRTVITAGKAAVAKRLGSDGNLSASEFVFVRSTGGSPIQIGKTKTYEKTKSENASNA